MLQQRLEGFKTEVCELSGGRGRRLLRMWRRKRWVEVRVSMDFMCQWSASVRVCVCARVRARACTRVCLLAYIHFHTHACMHVHMQEVEEGAEDVTDSDEDAS